MEADVDMGADPGELSDNRPAILLVEDEPATRAILSRQLDRAGYAVIAVSNGAEALDVLEKQFVPLLLTDWDMPEMNGVELCKAVREMSLDGYVYTILLNTRDGKANVLAGLAAGADDYLTKPPDDNELRARINTGRRVLRLEQSLRAANRRIHQLLITDALTAAYNRRYLMDRLPQEIERARRYQRPLAVVLCDVDHFKNINDMYGHQAGDRVLRSLATLLMGELRRDVDWVARYGGEEFLIVLPETQLNDAIAVAEKIRLSVASNAFDFLGVTISATASFGVAQYIADSSMEDTAVDALIAYADACLFRAKEGGRNRVTA